MRKGKYHAWAIFTGDNKLIYIGDRPSYESKRHAMIMLREVKHHKDYPGNFKVQKVRFVRLAK